MGELHSRLNLTYEGKTFKVYTIVPKDVPFDYVIMAPPEIIEDGDKDSNGYECTQLFDIVTNGGTRGVWKTCNSLSSQIMDLVMKKDIITQNFHTTVKPIIDSTIHFVEATVGGTIIRKLIRFRYNLQQT